MDLFDDVRLSSQLLAIIVLFIKFLLVIMNVVETQDWQDQGFAFFNVHTHPLNTLKNTDSSSVGLGWGRRVYISGKPPQDANVAGIHRPNFE